MEGSDYVELKSSSPQIPVQDNEMIVGIFPGVVITIEAGKVIKQIWVQFL
jgi:hypothetical protein